VGGAGSNVWTITNGFSIERLYLEDANRHPYADEAASSINTKCVSIGQSLGLAIDHPYILPHTIGVTDLTNEQIA
jgi:hypothetical protein